MQWACLACRKVFKKPDADASARVPCPDCGQPMTRMGKAFRAPRDANLAQWQKVELLAHNGFVFHKDGGERPAQLSEVPGFLEAQARRRMKPGQRLLEKFGEVQAKLSPTRPPAKGRDA